MIRVVIATISGFILALALGLAGMTKPSVVLGFLDVAGVWDPSLMFVMCGAIGFHLTAGFFIRKRSVPLFAPKFYVPDNLSIDKRLFIGAIIFGVGWGLAGVCPGPGYVGLGTLDVRLVYFVVAMLVGNLIFRMVDRFFLKRAALI